MSGGTNQTGGTGSGLVKWIDSRLPVFSYMQMEYAEF